MPFFSVIIPLFNKEKYIEATINSVLDQTFKDFEIIIIDDGSNDKSLSIVTKYKRDNLIIFNQTNNGLSASRNKGISIAKGKVIAFLDADDIWYPNFLSSIKLLYDSYPDASIYGTDYKERYSKHITLETKKNLSQNLKNKHFIVSNFFKANFFQFILCHSSIALKKEAFSSNFIYDEKITYNEDTDFFLNYIPTMKVAYYYKPYAEVSANIPDQVTKSSISNKVLPDFDTYEKHYSGNKSIKKFLDISRYKLAIKYSLEKNFNQKKKISLQIDKKNLSLKQNIIINLPLILLKLLRFYKFTVLKLGIRFTTFG